MNGVHAREGQAVGEHLVRARARVRVRVRVGVRVRVRVGVRFKVSTSHATIAKE